jgi:hypothetical protein
VFDSWNQWTWVTIAWLQLLVAYGGYLAYLGWRQRQLLRDDRAQRALQGVQRAPDGTRDVPDDAQRAPTAGGRP